MDQEVAAELESVNLRLRVSDDRMNNMETLIKENTDLTREVKEILDLGKTFFKILGYLGVAFKWVASLGAAAGVIWAGISHIKPGGN